METFIGLVRQLPCLWDTECKEYRDMRKKDIAWKRIVEELKRKDIPDSKYLLNTLCFLIDILRYLYIANK